MCCKKLDLKNLFKGLSIFFIFIGIAFLFVSFFLFFTDSSYFNYKESFDLEIANKFGGFISGLTGFFFTATGTFLVFLTFEQQREQYMVTQFENSFFNLLSHLQIIIEHITGPIINSEKKEESGRKYFFYQIRELNDLINVKIRETHLDKNSRYHQIAVCLSLNDNFKDEINLNLYKEFIKDVYDNFYGSRYSYLGHYFRFVFNLLNFVVNSNLSDKEKEKYINIVQAQMTSDELGLLLYNGLGKYGTEKLYPILEDYNFLSNIDKRVLNDPDNIAKLYPKTKFKFLIN